MLVDFNDAVEAVWVEGEACSEAVLDVAAAAVGYASLFAFASSLGELKVEPAADAVVALTGESRPD